MSQWKCGGVEDCEINGSFITSKHLWKNEEKTGGISRPNYISLAPAPAALSTLVSARAIAPTPDLPCWEARNQNGGDWVQGYCNNDGQGVMQTIRRPSSMSWLFVIMDVLEACKCKWQQALQNRKAKPKRQMQSQGKAFCTEPSANLGSGLHAPAENCYATSHGWHCQEVLPVQLRRGRHGRHCISHQLPVLLQSNELEHKRLSRSAFPLRGTTHLFVKCCNCV